MFPAFTDLDSLSNMSTSFMASYSFCSSVIPSMGLGCSSSKAPVIGFILEIKEAGRENYQKTQNISLFYGATEMIMVTFNSHDHGSKF